MGTGECAGEVISVTQFDLADAERLVFEGQIHLENENYGQADALAYRAMTQAALSLVKTQFLDVPDNPDTVVSEFRRRFYDTGLLGDRYAGNKFAEYLFRRHDAPPPDAYARSGVPYRRGSAAFHRGYVCMPRLAR